MTKMLEENRVRYDALVTDVKSKLEQIYRLHIQLDVITHPASANMVLGYERATIRDAQRVVNNLAGISRSADSGLGLEVNPPLTEEHRKVLLDIQDRNRSQWERERRTHHLEFKCTKI